MRLLLLCALFSSQAVWGQIQLQITLSGSPSNVSVGTKKLKYGKEGAFSIVYDDRPLSALDGFNLMPTFTDGTGKQIKYTASIASNGVTYSGQDFSANGALTLQQLKFLVENSWGLSDHGYYHGVNQQLTDAGFTVSDNVEQNRLYHFNQLKNLGAEYILRTGVVPNNDAGYHSVWEQKGYLAGVSQNTFDNYTANPAADYVNDGVANVNNLSAGYQVFARRFSDLVNQANTNNLINNLNTLFSQSSPSNAALLIYGTHETQNPFLSQILNHIQNNGGDRIWVTSLHEFMEYNEVRHKTSISHSVSGNVVTINLNQQLPDATRWRDLSLQLVSDQNILNVTATGADSVSFNAATGLINVYKRKTSGFSLNTGSSLPVRFTSFKGFVAAAGIQLEWKVADAGNVSRFEIEKSVNGTNFRNIGNTTQNRFVDKQVEELQFYRIKAVETGRPVYSNIIQVIRKNHKATIQYNKGTGASIQMLADQDKQTKAQVYNSAGQLIFEKTFQLTRGTNHILIPDPNSSGLFYVRIGNENLSFVK